ncbi:hypothetical protein BDZ97DRAFT_1920804 [Flammula alnicola]|nr:hypothetical protein BDZ97DRAFT_1920804 [Flammula alnicola]
MERASRFNCQSSMYSALHRSLVEEGLIDTGLISDIHNLPITRSSSYLYDLNQPFILDLAHNQIHLSLATRRSIEAINMVCAFKDNSRGILRSPYTGLVRASFELSTLPEHVKLGPTLLLRILDIVQPVQSAEIRASLWNGAILENALAQASRASSVVNMVGDKKDQICGSSRVVGRIALNQSNSRFKGRITHPRVVDFTFPYRHPEARSLT